MSDFYIKEGDRLPYIRSTLLDAVGAAINLTGATVQLRLRKQGQTSPKFTSNGALIDAVNGVVEYQWGASDTDDPAVYDAEWVVNFGGQKMTIPNSNYITVHILKNLTGA